MIPKTLTKYRVEFDDCCVGGHFTAVCTYVDAEGSYIKEVRFDNGMILTNAHGVTFKDVS